MQAINQHQRQYLDGPHGQLHVRIWGELSTQPSIICLPPAPSTSVAFNTLAPLLAMDRQIIAIDYPGYGGSDGINHQPTISDYATAVSSVIAQTQRGKLAILLGFHTGCLIAFETSLSDPTNVHSQILVDVPMFEIAQREKYLLAKQAPFVFPTKFEMLEEKWNASIAKRLKYLSPERAYEIFVDNLSAGGGTNAAFCAAFKYPCEERFPLNTIETYVIATRAGLYQETCNAASLISRASLVELPQIAHAVLDAGADELGQVIHGLVMNSGTN